MRRGRQRTAVGPQQRPVALGGDVVLEELEAAVCTVFAGMANKADQLAHARDGVLVCKQKAD